MPVEYHSFPNAELAVQQHKVMMANVELEVYTRPDDPYGNEVVVNESEYDEGVRVEGELFVDEPVVCWPERPVICRGVPAELELIFEHDITKINILFTVQTNAIDLVPRRFRRYFWRFLAIGRPINDALELYPPHYRGPKMKIFTVTNFRGLWPVGVAAVAVGRDQRDARRQLDLLLEHKGIAVRADYDLVEVDTSKPSAIILQDGSY